MILIDSNILINSADLYTNNVSDFKNIKDFKIVNPIKTRIEIAFG